MQIILIKGKKQNLDTFNEYGSKYKRIEEEKRKKKNNKRQTEQQREWEERFRQWAEYQNSQRVNSYGGVYSSYGGKTIRMRDMEIVM